MNDQEQTVADQQKIVAAQQQQQKIVANQAQIEAKAAEVEISVDSTVAPDPQDDKVGSVKVDNDTTTSTTLPLTTTAAAASIDLTQTFDEVVVITCHGCKEIDEPPVRITNLNVSLLETARTGTTAAASTITGFGPPNIPSVLKRINEHVKQSHPGTPTTLKDVYDVVAKHTGNTYHKTEAFFAEGSQFVFLTPTVYSARKGYFEIHEAQLFGTGCRLRHSGIFALDQDGQVQDITFNLGLTPNTQVRYTSKTKNCNDNTIRYKTSGMVQKLVNITISEMTKVKAQIIKLTGQKKNQLTPDQIVWVDKRINILTRLLMRYDGDLQYLQYKLQPYGYIESGSHVKYFAGISMVEQDKTVRLSDILNHHYFSIPNKKYLVILHVCKVSCGYSRAQGTPERTRSFQSDTVDRLSFNADSLMIVDEPYDPIPKPNPPVRALNPYGGGNLNRRKSGSKKKKARAAHAVTRTKRNRQKKRRGTRNKNNNNTNKRRKNK
jgi:hypothetical protein